MLSRFYYPAIVGQLTVTSSVLNQWKLPSKGLAARPGSAAARWYMERKRHVATPFRCQLGIVSIQLQRSRTC